MPKFTVGDIAVDTSVTELYLWGSKVKDLRGIEGLTCLKNLQMYHTDVADLPPLAGLSIETLNLQGCDCITDITPLSTLKSLQFLDLRDVSFPDIAPLSELPALKTLYLLDRPATRDLSPLSKLPMLQELHLWHDFRSPSTTDRVNLNPGGPKGLRFSCPGHHRSFAIVRT